LINKTSGRRISALVVVHVFGNLARMEKLMAVARKYHLKVLEDATEALGSYYTNGEYKGCFAGTIADMGVYSFNANKIISTGGGGMIVAKRKNELDHARYLSITAKDDSLYFVHNEVGYNYRMLNLQAALGVSQIDELEKFIAVKKRNLDKYKEILEPVNGLSFLPFAGYARPNYWFYSLIVEKSGFGMGRDELMHGLISTGIQCRPVWKLNHTQKAYTGCQAYQIEKAYRYEAEILNLPCSTNLTIEEVVHICSKIIEKSK
jgi:dTDP-4-amino-4,6-dideoxygalactose transaminase